MAPTGTTVWMEEGTRLLIAALDRLSDDDLDAPTALPGWSRRHVLSHLGFNAEALRRLASWARSGKPSPMYASSDQRTSEIARGVTWDAVRLRHFVTDSAQALRDELAGLSCEAWQREVVTAQGRTVPATEIPWMRTREVVVHTVDLDAGLGFDDLPVDLCAALVTDVAALRSKRGDGPALLLTSEGEETWHVHGVGDPTRLRGTVCAVAGWLTGRGGQGVLDERGGPAPQLGAWL